MARFTPLLTHLFMLGLAFIAPAGAQELPKAARIENVEWYQVTFYRFKPGMAAEARSIIYDHFIPADRAAGRDGTAYDFRTGDWHHVVWRPMAEGASDLEWQTSPATERFRAELARRLGEKEAADLVQRFNATIEAQRAEVAMKRIP